MVSSIPEGVRANYQLQFRRCGRPNCRTCSTGPGHGPYWYAFWRDPESKRLRSTYVGKDLPPGVDVTRRPERAQQPPRF